VKGTNLALRVLFGIGLCAWCVYFLLQSGILGSIEGLNEDGSSSLTWRSGVLLIFSIVAGQITSFGAFRKKIVLSLCMGAISCTLIWMWLAGSRFGYSWELHNSDGTFPLTWRSNLLIFGLMSVTQAILFVIFRILKSVRLSNESGE
jgi:hypothetical protein